MDDFSKNTEPAPNGKTSLARKLYSQLHATRKAISGGEENHVVARVVTCVIILLFGAIITVHLVLIKPEPKEKAQEELIKTLQAEPVKVGPITTEIFGYGTAEPIQEVTLSAELKGRIVMKAADLKTGSLIEKDELLAKIDVADYEIQLQQSVADIAKLQADYAQLKQYIKDAGEQLKKEEKIVELDESDFNRQKSLQRQGISATKEMEKAERSMVAQRKMLINTQSELNQKTLQLQTILALLQRAEAEKKMAGINIKRSFIHSPFKGRIKKLHIDNGEYVQPGTPLFDVADDTTLEIPVGLDAINVASIIGLKSAEERKYANWFRNPPHKNVKIEWMEAPEMCCWNGNIERIEDFNPETRTVKFIVRPTAFLSGREGFFPIVSGMFCKVIFTGATLPSAARISWAAIQLDGDVYVVNAQGRLEQRKVVISGTEGDQAIISSGLKDGEMLVTQRLPRGVVNGMKVKAVTKSGMSYKVDAPPAGKSNNDQQEKVPENRSGEQTKKVAIKIAARI